MENFIDVYDFLGIPPSSPPNLIYIAIQYRKKKLLSDSQSSFLNLCQEILLNNAKTRSRYEKEWTQYYFPEIKGETDFDTMKTRISSHSFFQTQNSEPFSNKDDFYYFIIRTLEKERTIFPLSLDDKIQLPPLQDTIFFTNGYFFLQYYGDIPVSIYNESMGRFLKRKTPYDAIPLFIGDRLEFSNGTNLVLRTMYKCKKNNAESLRTVPPCHLYSPRENIYYTLDPQKNYILGRQPQEIEHIFFNQDYVLIDIGCEDRSISRQNSQIFCQHNQWYIQDIGSKYGTTVEYKDHDKLETLVGEKILPLKYRKIRLGYDKSYYLEICSEIKYREPHTIVPKGPRKTIYEVPLWLKSSYISLIPHDQPI